ncbi:hypothetical protein [Thermopirellula anaerolimosa]
MEPIVWPKREGDELRVASPVASEPPGPPPLRPHNPHGESVPDSRRVRRLPPPEPSAAGLQERLRAAAEAVEPIPDYPDTGYPAILP